jgi:putative FmdB family regulatory protein
MPTYEYACQSCGTHVEVFQRFNDEPLTECGLCGGPLRKVFHPAGILFKGPGFYSTDSRSKAGAGSKSGGDKSDSSGGQDSAPPPGKPPKSDTSVKADKPASPSTKERSA